jgi:hypothetical protein
MGICDAEVQHIAPLHLCVQRDEEKGGVGPKTLPHEADLAYLVKSFLSSATSECCSSPGIAVPLRSMLARSARSYPQRCPRSTNETRTHRPKAVASLRGSAETLDGRVCLSSSYSLHTCDRFPVRYTSPVST